MPDDSDGHLAQRCPWCQSIAFSSEDQLRILVAHMERRLHDLGNRALLAGISVVELTENLDAARDRVAELEEIVARQNRRLQARNHARST
jgi:hypothetical protein